MAAFLVCIVSCVGGSSKDAELSMTTFASISAFTVTSSSDEEVVKFPLILAFEVSRRALRANSD